MSSERSENQFVRDGRKYLAKPEDSCRGCAVGNFQPPRCHEFPPCVGWARHDRKNVVFVEADGEK